MSFKFPIGVATIYSPKLFFCIYFLSIFLISCSPVNLSPSYKKPEISDNPKQLDTEKTDHKLKIEEKNDVTITNSNTNNSNYKINKNITILFSNENKAEIIKQFTNVLEMGVYDKKLQNVNLKIEYFNNESDLLKLITNRKNGSIFIGPVDTRNTRLVKKHCKDNTVFFSFSSDTSLAGGCVYLINFFPKNELEQIFKSLNSGSKVAILYPENEYGYMINQLIDDVANNSDAIIVNRASYKKDLSNVRNAIKELGKYELRKYELDRQKKLLNSKKDNSSLKRLKQLEKFKTTSDYDFTHILIADYGLNLLQVAPLLPYYDIDPNIVQFIGTGVIDDENFFYEPSLQGAIFPGIEKNKRFEIINRYSEIYNDNFMRISTLPYDLLGLLNFVFSKDMTFNDLSNLLKKSNIRFDGVDGNFYFKNQMIERDLKMLKISNGNAFPIN